MLKCFNKFNLRCVAVENVDSLIHPFGQYLFTPMKFCSPKTFLDHQNKKAFSWTTEAAGDFQKPNDLMLIWKKTFTSLCSQAGSYSEDYGLSSTKVLTQNNVWGQHHRVYETLINIFHHFIDQRTDQLFRKEGDKFIRVDFLLVFNDFWGENTVVLFLQHSSDS